MQAREQADAEDVDRILWPLLDGLEQVHNAGFLHRDIKPANILLDAAGNPTLIDFGASRAAMAGRSTALTAIFTPGYAAAEQMTSAKQGPWTDIYGLVGHALSRHHRPARRPAPSTACSTTPTSRSPQLEPAGFSPRRAGRHRCRPRGGRPRPAADHRRLAADPRHDRRRRPRCHGRHRQGLRHGPARPEGRHVSTLPPPAAAGAQRPDRPVDRRSPSCCSPCWAAAATTPSPRAAPIPRRSRRAPRRRRPKRKRLKAEEEAAKLRAENEQRQKAERSAEG